jgi:alkylation response protein AidB-like acyl-CoA dehydrogenase
MTSNKLNGLIETVSPQLAEWAAEHDAERTFVERGYRLLKENGFFGALVPEALGGLGASLPEVCDALRRLARACPATALAASMHSHLVAAVVWRFRHGAGGEPLLRKIAAQQLVLVSTGANDGFESNGTLEATQGGYVLRAKKAFCSGSPMGDLLVTSSVFQHPTDGAQVFHFAVPFTAKGVKVGSDWDTLGMRGTGSQSVELDGVFVPDESITVRRPRAGWAPVWQVVLTVAPPIYMAPYLGVAEAARDRAIALARKAPRGETALLVGEMENELTAARLAFESMVGNANDLDFKPEIARADRALVAKTLLAGATMRTVQKAMEVVGGASYFRSTGIERLLRDVLGAPNHPMPEKRQQLVTGRLALGLDPLVG